MRRFPVAVAFAAAALFGGLPQPALAAISREFSLEILVDGRPLEEWTSKGRLYVEALKGREYSVRLVNRTPEPVAVALSVDGLNVIDAAHTTAVEGRKWILDPYQALVLDGWQTGRDTARRFYFTDEKRSYGAWLGRTDDLGVVAASFFRRRRPEPEIESRVEAGGRNAPTGCGAPAPEARAKKAADAQDELAATGIGRQVDHHVRTVEFDHEDHPAATLSLRYEYRDALVKLGVIPPPPRPDDRLARRDRARGFEDEGFAPDPYRRPR